ALKRYSAWLLEEDETDTDAIRDLKPPQVDVKVVEGLTDAQCAEHLGALAKLKEQEAAEAERSRLRQRVFGQNRERAEEVNE
ncbi:MAG: Integrase, partial [Mycobacterium sp.]|nr:Integrase [Mycobacterium sp.]